MTYNPNIDSGYLELKSWVQVPSAVFVGIEQSTELDNSQYPERSGRNYAQLVHQVNSPPVTISGDVIVDAVGLDDSGTVKLSGDQLKVYDGEVITKLDEVITNLGVTNYSSIIKISGDYTYIMKTETSSGATSAQPVWQISRIYDDGITIAKDWADGNDNYDNVASDFLSLSYSL